MSSRGHVYFSLKDEKDGALINCIIWKSRYAVYGVELKEGVKIIASGYPEIYAPSGRISFIAETIELAGEGALKKAYEKLKKKLAAEGLFEEERKRPLPKYPEKIGVVTSRQGAVLADFLNNLGKFGFKIKMIDSRVEGQLAVADLLLSIKSFQKQDIDALVIIRGGGSLESHLAFNNEMLVRAIADFPVPVIAGIGHHTRVGGHHAVHVGPNPHLVGAQGAPQDGSRIVTATAPHSGGNARLGRTDEPCHHRGDTFRD